MGVTPGRLPGATVSQDKTSGVRRSVEVELVGYLLLCHEQGMRKGQGLGEDRGAEKAATKWLRSTTVQKCIRVPIHMQLCSTGFPVGSELPPFRPASPL